MDCDMCGYFEKNPREEFMVNDGENRYTFCNDRSCMTDYIAYQDKDLTRGVPFKIIKEHPELECTNENLRDCECANCGNPGFWTDYIVKINEPRGYQEDTFCKNDTCWRNFDEKHQKSLLNKRRVFAKR